MFLLYLLNLIEWLQIELDKQNAEAMPEFRVTDLPLYILYILQVGTKL